MVCDEHKASFDKYEVDVEEIINLVKQMSANAIKVKDIIPEPLEFLLKHIAAICIHLTFFMKDLTKVADIAKIKNIDEVEETEKQFLSQCGCDIDKDD